MYFELVRQAVGQRHEGVVPGAERAPPRAAPGVALGQRDLGLEHQRVGAAVDDPAVGTVHLHAGRGQAVVEAGLELERDLDLAGLAVDQAQQLVVGTGPRGVAEQRAATDHQAVGDRDAAAAGGHARLQHVGAWQVAAADRVGGARGGDAEVAAPGPVEQPGEHRPGVEAVEAAPVDGPVARHQGGGMAVPEQRVGGQRWVAITRSSLLAHDGGGLRQFLKDNLINYRNSHPSLYVKRPLVLGCACGPD